MPAWPLGPLWAYFIYARPRSDGERKTLRILLVVRYTNAITTRTAAVNVFKLLLLTAPDELREPLRRLSDTPADRRVRQPARPGPSHPHRTDPATDAARPRPAHSPTGQADPYQPTATA